MTTFNTGNYVRITSQQSGWNDPPLSLFSSLCFSRSLPSRRTPLFERLEQANRIEVPFPAFPERVGQRILSLETFDYFGTSN